LAYARGPADDGGFEGEGFASQWLRDGGAVVYVIVGGARYQRVIPKNGYLTHREAGALLGTNRETVWRWVQGGKLTGYMLRGVQVVSIAELRKFGRENGYQVPA
jgi:excisionase family DNA binding protein